MRTCRSLIFGAAACLAFMLLTGCEENVTAILGTEHAFSFYGVLTPQADTQKVVVYPIADRLIPQTPESLDASVRAIDLTAGQTYPMRDSAFRESDGRWAHVFYWTEPAAYDHTYRIEAENSEGEVTWVEVTVPPRVELDLQTPETQGYVQIPVFVKGEAPRLMHIEMTYRFQFRPGPVDETVDTLYIDYDEQQKKVDGGWMINIALTRDYQRLYGWCANNGCWRFRDRWGLLLLDMRLRLAVVNEAWNPPGSGFDPGVHTEPLIMPSFDPEVLVQPGTMSNVEHGFGFVGAGYRLEKDLKLEESVLQQAGFRGSL